MDDAHRYIEEVRGRLVANGFAVSDGMIAGLETVVGYKSQFKMRWLATNLHTFVCVAAVPNVTYGVVEHFTASALKFANEHKGDARGFQSGVAVIAAVVGPCDDPRASALVEHQITKKFAAFAWPVLYETKKRTLVSHRGRPRIGAIYTGWMRRQIAENLQPVT